MDVREFATRWALHYVNPDFLKIPTGIKNNEVFLYLEGISDNIAYKIYNSKNQLIYSTDYSHDKEIKKYVKIKNFYYWEKIDKVIYSRYAQGGYLIEKTPYLDPGNRYKEDYYNKNVKATKGLVLPNGEYKIKIAQSPYWVAYQERQFTITNEDRAKGVNGKALKVINVSDMTNYHYKENEYVYVVAKIEYKLGEDDRTEYSTFSETEYREHYTWSGIDPGSAYPNRLEFEDTYHGNQKAVLERSSYQFYQHFEDGTEALIGESVALHNQGGSDNWREIASGQQAIYLGNDRWVIHSTGLKDRTKVITDSEWVVADSYTEGLDHYVLRSYGDDISHWWGYIVHWYDSECCDNYELVNDTFIIRLSKRVQDQYYLAQNYVYGHQDRNPRIISTYYHLTASPGEYDGVYGGLYYMPAEAIKTPKYVDVDEERFLERVEVDYQRQLPDGGTSTMPPPELKIPPTDPSYHYNPREQYLTEALSYPPSTWDGAFLNGQQIVYTKWYYPMRTPQMTWYSNYGEQKVAAYGIMKTFNREQNFMELFLGNKSMPYKVEADFGEYEEAMKKASSWDTSMRCYWRKTQPEIFVIDISDIPEYNPEN